MHKKQGSVFTKIIHSQKYAHPWLTPTRYYSRLISPPLIEDVGDDIGGFVDVAQNHALGSVCALVGRGWNKWPWPDSVGCGQQCKGEEGSCKLCLLCGQQCKGEDGQK